MTDPNERYEEYVEDFDKRFSELAALDIDPDNEIGRPLPETEKLMEFLKTVEIGQVITYDEMRDACKIDPRVKRGPLFTVRKWLLDRGVVFGTVKNVGVVRLSDQEMPVEAIHKQNRARRQARKGVKILDCVDLSKVDANAKVVTLTTRTVLGLIMQSSSYSVRKLATKAAVHDSANLKIGRVADLFKDKDD